MACLRLAGLHHGRTAEHVRWAGQGLMARNAPSADHPIAFLKERAKAMRRHMLRMSRAMGQGYLAQGLGIADPLAAIYFHELRYDPANLQWPERDRFILSTGHYSIALWAAF